MLHTRCVQLGDDRLRSAMGSIGVSNGLAVRPPDPAAVKFRLFFRGSRLSEVHALMTCAHVHSQQY